MKKAALAQGKGERRWPMAAAALLAGSLRAFLPPDLRLAEGPGTLLVVLIVLVIALTVGDPGRIDRQSGWLRVTGIILVGAISAANAGSTARLVVAMVDGSKFANNAGTLFASGGIIWLTNVITFGLWFWDLDRGGAAARATGSTVLPAFLFPEMTNAEFVRSGWSPSFVDYLHVSFNTAMAFSPTDVSPLKAWAKLMMMTEAAISLVVAILVVGRAVNVLQ